MFLFLFKWYIHFFFFKYEKVTMAGLASSDICQQNHAFKILMKLVKIISTVAVDDDIDDVCRFRFSQLTTASPRGPLTREHLRRLRLFASNICLCGKTSNNFNLRRSIKRPFCSKTLSLLFRPSLTFFPNFFFAKCLIIIYPLAIEKRLTAKKPLSSFWKLP